MTHRMEKWISLFVAAIMVAASLSFTVYGEEPVDVQEQIDELLSRRAECVSLGDDEGIEEIDRQLAALGVVELTAEEVAERFPEAAKAIYITRWGRKRVFPRIDPPGHRRMIRCSAMGWSRWMLQSRSTS